MNKIALIILIPVYALFVFSGCESKKEQQNTENTDSLKAISVIFDTDANNEIDDQHALAYLILNKKTFDIVGVTVNATPSGGAIDLHYLEAGRVIKICSAQGKFPLLKGANGNFKEIMGNISQPEYDGKDAVEFIITESRKERKEKLVLIPVGKLTNVALALLKAPDIAKKVRIVWLGSNYPKPGEYNQDNDIPALNYLLDQPVDFEIVTVRYDDTTGSAAVTVTPALMKENMPGAGPAGDTITGRHGGSFHRFGDYSMNLFEHVELYGNPPSRSLFDVVAVAIVKESKWGIRLEIPAPTFDIKAGKWVDRNGNQHKITLWEKFDKQAILNDFFGVIKGNK